MIIFEFIIWYYVKALANIVLLWKNFVEFFFYFFGFSYHIRTLFRPWHAMVLSFQGGSRIQVFFYNLTSRVLASVVGFFARAVTMIFGACVSLVWGACLPVFLIVWVFLPFFIVFLVVRGFSILI